MTKKIVISGYYGFDNLGDEAVLQSIIQALRSEIPDLDITVLSNNPYKTAKSYKVKARNRWKISEIYRVLKESDLLISGGGSLLQDVTSQKNIPYYLGVVGIARTLGKKVAFYAQGVGPIEGTMGCTLTRVVANRVQLITVRDQESYELLRKLGVSKPPMKVTVDPVVLLKSRIPGSKEYQAILEISKAAENEGVPLIGIAPRPWKEINQFKKEIVQTIDYLQNKRGAKILLIPMHREMDLPLCHELAEKHSGVWVLTEQYQPDEMLAFFELLHLLIGIRLHALIFAAVANVPIIGISYDPKIDNFLTQISEEAIARLDNLKADLLYSEISKKLGNLFMYRQQIAGRTEILQNKARENARLVLDLLN